jgi:hypothetical protein
MFYLLYYLYNKEELPWSSENYIKENKGKYDFQDMLMFRHTNESRFKYLLLSDMPNHLKKIYNKLVI